MAFSIDAVYEGGVFRPTSEVCLQEGTHVEVILPVIRPARDSRLVAQHIARVAAQTTSAGPETSSVDHDKVLYGDQNPS